MEKLPHKAIWLFRFQIFRGFGFLLAMILLFFYGISFAFSLAQETEPLPEGLRFVLFVKDNIFLLCLGAVVFLVIFAYIYGSLWHRFFGYEVAGQTFRVKKGVIAKSYKSIPFEKIQNVDIHRTLICRILKVSILHIETAGYSGMGGAEINVPGLEPAQAEELREELIGRAKRVTSGV